jgi:hypothetical protein
MLPSAVELFLSKRGRSQQKFKLSVSRSVSRSVFGLVELASAGQPHKDAFPFPPQGLRPRTRRGVPVRLALLNRRSGSFKEV